MVASAAGGLGDAEWLRARLSVLTSRAEDLSTELASHQADAARLAGVAREFCDTHAALEADAAAESRAEREAANETEAEQAALCQARGGNAELQAERRALLRELEEKKMELGQRALTVDQCREAGARCNKGRDVVAQRTKALRNSLRAMGDTQASLAAKETEEREERRALRQSLRERLQREEDHIAELQRRLAGRDAELELWRRRFEAARDAEQRALAEAADYRRRTRRCEKVEAPAHKVEREELLYQLRELTAADAQLREELQQARERLFGKLQKQQEQQHEKRQQQQQQQHEKQQQQRHPAPPQQQRQCHRPPRRLQESPRGFVPKEARGGG
mmetsp:Transcript_15030/g.41306  ORF Transcript_15030/g.41306 Transcript_15030/m.41306 type:complete len:334 (+) Transcript_15030:60-1061(+)